MSSTIERATEHLGRATAALEKINGSAKAARQLLALLGWSLPPGVDDIGLTQLNVSTVVARIDDLIELRSQENAPDADIALAVTAVVAALAESFDGIEQMVDGFQATPDYLSATGIADEFFDRLADLLVIHAIGSAAPAAIPVGALLGVFEFTHKPADPSIFQVEHVRQVVRWDRFSTLFTDPTNLLRDVYGWGTANFQGNALITNIGRVVEFVAADARLRALPRAAEEQFAGRPVPEADSDPAAQLFVSLDRGLGFGAFDAGLTLYTVRPTTPGGTDGGVGVSPYVFGTAETSFELSDNLSLVLTGSAALQGGIAVLLRGGRDPQLLTDLLGTTGAGSLPAVAGLAMAPGPADAHQARRARFSAPSAVIDVPAIATTTGITGDPGPNPSLLAAAAGSPGSSADFTMALRRAAPDGARRTLFSAPGVLVDAAAVAAGIGINAGPDLDPSLLVKVEDGRIHVGADGADGFLASILPSDGLTLDASVELAWSRREGLRIKGGAGLRTRLAVNRRFGPLRVDTLDLALAGTPEALVGSATVTGSTTIGPVTAVLDSVGTEVALRFRRGNLGPVDLAADFVPPKGIGLSVEAGGVLTGGGFLFHDPVQHVYAGVMQLTLHETITLKAFGLIGTRLPDGSKGYSLLVFITAEDFKPIPLGLGLTLQGIGGMIGIHRTFSEDAMREGLKNNTLGTLLFPKDPIRNAPEIIRNLGTTFPARSGSYLFGVLAKIGWFSPPLVVADLALIFEFGARKRLIVLGRISSMLPSRQNDLIRLNLDAMGVIDFDKGTASIDAVLVDSRLANKFVLTGGMALRARWKKGPGAGFVLAVGGFNPRFAPPEGMPILERVTIALSAGKNPRLTCAAYFAITSNTIQWGARAQLYAEAYGFSVEGDVGYDVLIQLSPFHFLAEFQASIQLKRGSRNLFKVALAGELEGPRPLRVSGKASFEILWCDFTVRFDKTLVEGEKPPLPPSVDVLAELTRALTAAESWSTLPAAHQQHGVTLRTLQPGGPLVLDPLGNLMVKQSVVPLNTTRDVDTFGGAPVTGDRRFKVTATLNGKPQEGGAVRDQFVPAQFFTMTDDEKLASPSFDDMDAGLVFGSDTVSFDEQQIVAGPLTYESIVIDEAGESSSTPDFELSAAQLLEQASFGAVAMAPIRSVGLARFRDAGAAGAVTLSTPAWVIASVSDTAAVAPDTTAGATWTETRAAMATLNRGVAGAVAWQLVPVHETLAG